MRRAHLSHFPTIGELRFFCLKLRRFAPEHRASRSAALRVRSSVPVFCLPHPSVRPQHMTILGTPRKAEPPARVPPPFGQPQSQTDAFPDIRKSARARNGLAPTSGLVLVPSETARSPGHIGPRRRKRIPNSGSRWGAAHAEWHV